MFGSFSRSKPPCLSGVFFLLGVATLLVAVPAALAQEQPNAVIHVDHGANAAATAGKHYVVLVSLDGFRYDYARKYGAKNLLAMAAHGASAPDGMLPSYPSITFPNHYTLVTGLYPEHHGIVGMQFYDPARKEQYSFNKASALDGSWYGGEPLWVLAEKQGMRAACFFWPGSEAAIDGERPSYYLHFDKAYPDEGRVEQVLDWLKLPEPDRPHFITLYYSNTDDAGHKFGPDAPETRDAVHHVDELIGELRKGLAATHLPVDLVVVSDHGMIKQDPQWITLDADADLSKFTTVGAFLYAPSEGEAQAAYDKLKSADARFMVYRRKDVPAALAYNSNPREGDPVIVPRGPYAIRAHAPSDPAKDEPPHAGAHGFDPREVPEMKAIFYAEGPDIRPGTRLKVFENINVYPMLAHMLALQPPEVDGSLTVLSPALRDRGAEHQH